MTTSLECPTCTAPLREVHDGLECHEQHRYTPLELARSTNQAAVLGLWRAIRLLEDDAAGLEWLADREDAEPPAAAARREEAASARAAAAEMRARVTEAQRRLKALGEHVIPAEERS